jgi:thiol-disulfide isomerase/thioredoxin
MIAMLAVLLPAMLQVMPVQLDPAPRPAAYAAPNSTSFSPAGVLTVMPASPRRAETLAFTYRPGPPELASEQSLAVRARLRTATMDDRGDGTIVRLALLERGTDGVFRGAAELPDSVVYAAFVVERIDGRAVDARGGRFTNVVVRDDDGLPSYHGLVQRAHDHLGRDYLTVLETGLALTEHSPARPFSWMVRIAAEEWVRGAVGALESRRLIDERYPKLAAAAANQPDSPPEDLEILMYFANAVDDDTAANAFYERLQSRWPASPVATRMRLAALAERLEGRPGELLDSLETAWAAGDRSAELAEWGVMAGRRGGDESRHLLWTQRYGAATNDPFFGVARLARSRAYRAEALPVLRDHVGRLALGEHRRAFGRAVPDQQAANAQALARALIALGEVLMEHGSTAAGLDALRAATQAVFSPWPARPFGEALLAEGDSAAALVQFARMTHAVGADPAWADSVRLRLGARFDDAEWDRLVAEARMGQLERAAASLVERAVPASVRVTDDAGAVRSLGELGGGGTTLIMLWSRGCEASQRVLPAVRALASELAGRGVHLVALTLDEPAADDAAFRVERGVTFPVFHDVTGDATAFLRGTGTPQFFLVDPAGTLRAARSDLESLPWQVEALQLQARSSSARHQANALRQVHSQPSSSSSRNLSP